MHEIIIAAIILVIILIIYYLYKEGFLTGMYRYTEGFSTGTIYTSGGTQRFASQFSGTNQGPESITQAAFSEYAQAGSEDLLEHFRSSSKILTKGLGETFNTNTRKNSNRMEHFSQDNLPSLVLDSVLLNRNIGESGISGTEILLQNELHGDLYDNYI